MDWEGWEPRLGALCDVIREVTRAALREADERGDRSAVTGVVGRGVGDVTFGLDVPGERAIERWMRETARSEPLSVLTEDAGWRHMGPSPSGAAVELPGFDHGGPRIVLDPVDGTRNLMVDLRSAWTVVALAGPGPDEPRLCDLVGGTVAEIPTLLAAVRRTLSAPAGGECRYEEHLLADGSLRAKRVLRVDDDDRVDHGYFPFFRYKPELRPELARLEAAFFARLAEHEGADVRSCYDDQYISNAGQLVLLALGTYRSIVDARALVAERLGVTTVTSKPYDVAGAIVCAEAAGAVVTAADGKELDFAIDAQTPVHFAGYANAPTRARLEPHWLATLAQ